MKKIMKKSVKALSFVTALAFAIMGFCGIYEQSRIPDEIYLPNDGNIGIEDVFPVKIQGIATEMPDEIALKSGNKLKLKLVSLGGSAVKNVSVNVVDRKWLVPSGQPFGIKMFTEGVMVVGMSDIDTGEKIVNPAKDAGLKTGDIITTLNGKKVLFNEQVEKIVAENGNKKIKAEYMRNGVSKIALINPVYSKDDKTYKIGIWVRDSSAGIGTMTYIDPNSGRFAGLGHGVCDMDTDELMPLRSGEISDVVITGVKKGYKGKPGELKGMFTSSYDIGHIEMNDETGIYGDIKANYCKNKAVPIAYKEEIHTGKAKILATLDGAEPCEYDIIIEKINNSGNTKNMIIKASDQVLLDKAGGIVQGMSGSPILQDGKLIGAVTHVFVNDPTRGYGIFIENMV